MTSAIQGRLTGAALAAILMVAPSACLAGGVPAAHPPPAQHTVQPRLNIGNMQMRRYQLDRHLNRIVRRQWALQECRKKHPPKSKARKQCLRKARKLPAG